MYKHWLIINGWHIIDSFETERGAKISLTRKYKKRYPNARIMSRETFNETEPMVETRNLLNPEKAIMIPASQKGGCCDPGTETYHTVKSEVKGYTGSLYVDSE